MTDSKYNMQVNVNITKVENSGKDISDYYTLNQIWYDLPYDHLVLLEKDMVETLVKASKYGQAKVIASGVDPKIFSN